MKFLNHKKQAGFTLIETVIYLALFGIMFSGAIAGAYSIMESSNRNHAWAMAQEEGQFLIAKIGWAVSNAKSASVPAVGRLSAAVGSDNLEFALAGTDLTLARNVSPAEPLNDSIAMITNLYFNDISLDGSGQKGIGYGFDLEAKTPNGGTVKSKFSSTAYLRK
jgi:prepilin-type N-terminal cleavage/methylation domain-containing protein